MAAVSIPTVNGSGNSNANGSGSGNGSGVGVMPPLLRAPSIPPILHYRLTDVKTALAIEPWITTDQLTPKPDDSRAIRRDKLQLGWGAYATVYKLRLHGVDTVAVKMLREGIQGALRAEAAMMMRVACPQVISLYGVSGALPNSEDPPCLLMEYARHGALGRLLKAADNPLQSWFRRMRILVDVAKGLARLHQCSPPVIHMDLKPDNILICRGMRAKLTDFGCSKLDITRAPTEAIGTVSHMPPESFQLHAPPDMTWDIWAFAMLMFEVCTLRPPWPSGATAHALSQEIHRGVRPVIPTTCDAAKGAPDGYESLMHECWSLDPKQRPHFVMDRTGVTVDGVTITPRAILPRLLTMLKQARQRCRDERRKHEEKQKQEKDDLRSSADIVTALLKDTRIQLAEATAKLAQQNDEQRAADVRYKQRIDELQQQIAQQSQVIHDLQQQHNPQPNGDGDAHIHDDAQQPPSSSSSVTSTATPTATATIITSTIESQLREELSALRLQLTLNRNPSTDSSASSLPSPSPSPAPLTLPSSTSSSSMVESHDDTITRLTNRMDALTKRADRDRRLADGFKLELKKKQDQLDILRPEYERLRAALFTVTSAPSPSSSSSSSSIVAAATAAMVAATSYMALPASTLMSTQYVNAVNPSSSASASSSSSSPSSSLTNTGYVAPPTPNSVTVPFPSIPIHRHVHHPPLSPSPVVSQHHHMTRSMSAGSRHDHLPHTLPLSLHHQHSSPSAMITQHTSEQKTIAIIPPSPLPSSLSISLSSTSTSSTSSTDNDPSPFPLSVYGLCTDCSTPTKLRVIRQCVECHSSDIADVDHTKWWSMIQSYDTCVHLQPTTCTSTRWHFVGVCHHHPSSSCMLLPGVIDNDKSLPCGGCQKVAAIVLRFGCGHFVCLNCWRKYAASKMDHEGLLFVPHIHDGGTLRCPSIDGCDSYALSSSLFLMLRGRDVQYRNLSMVRHDDAKDTELARLPLKDKFALTKPCPLCGTLSTRDGVSNMIACATDRCRASSFQWCWICESALSLSCKQYHPISS